MEKFCHLIIILFIPITLFTQNTNNWYESDVFLKGSSQRNQEWFLDSIYKYTKWEDEVNSEWDKLTVKKVLNRTEKGFPLQVEQYYFDFQTNENYLQYFTEYEYPNGDDTMAYTKVFWSNLDETGSFSDKLKRTIEYSENGIVSNYYETWDYNVWQQGNKTLIKDDSLEYLLVRQLKESENSSWINLFRERRIILPEQLKRINTKEMWVDNQWDTTEKRIEVFNEEGLVIEENYYHEDENNWQLKYRTLHEYLSSGKLISKLKQELIDNDWVDKRLYTYSYDEYQYLASEQEFISLESYWHYIDRVDYQNDSSGNIILKTDYYPLQDTIWGMNRKTEFLYNSNNQLVKRLIIDYKEDENIWLNQDKIEMSYDDSLISTEKHYLWNRAQNTWINYTEHVYEYDIEYLLSSYQSNYWDTIANMWIPRYKKEYDNTEVSDQRIRTEKRSNYNEAEGVWENKLKETEYWNKKITNTEELLMNPFHIYPNPTTNSITIEPLTVHIQNTRYELLDQNGKILKSGHLPIDGKISLQEYSNGQYLFRLYNQENKQWTVSIIKRN